MLSSGLRIGLQVVFSFMSSDQNFACICHVISPIRATFPSHLILDFITLIVVERTSYEASHYAVFCSLQNILLSTAVLKVMNIWDVDERLGWVCFWTQQEDCNDFTFRCGNVVFFKQRHMHVKLSHVYRLQGCATSCDYFLNIVDICGRGGSSVIIVTTRLQTGLPEFESRQGHRVQTRSEAHLASYIQWVLGALSPVVKRPGREADNSLPSHAQVKNAWSCTFTPAHVFMAWHLVKHAQLHLYLSSRLHHLVVFVE
jgi:hypothetical protein